MKRFLMVMLCLFPAALFAQQDAIYSQYLFNQLLINPAYAGSTETLNMNFLSRNQWTGITGAPTTQSALVDGAFGKAKKIGLGISFLNDKAGLENQTGVFMNYAYRLITGPKSRLSMGLGVGLTQYMLNGNDAVVDDISDPNFLRKEIYFTPDARAGVYYTSPGFFAGFSVTNLLTHVLNGSANSKTVILPYTHFFLTAGGIFGKTEQLKFKPSVMLRDDPSGMGNLDFNALFTIKEQLTLGASYRMGVNVWNKVDQGNARAQQNALIAMVSVFFAKQINLGYAYDYSLSQLNALSSGTHEISLGFILGRRSGWGTIKSPKPVQ
ncbi:PorP/SprF family type IX secretion system membrane protein [Pedobacter duraquae]|uniref:Type IX secretion system PorP/SprF family membrane protein n=1 Tax=Pedobacter duraquae TaxID=425511 RepID=A0A4R6IJ58_9SPHI|nr:type IX secretion system membrane protein PorP/SprF [Pedobacter duraquae]TDO22027.1 type IX secretion system PorP/SprF family membrane protein [Pedobacter duraquae]